jgi:hypothetical protein
MFGHFHVLFFLFRGRTMVRRMGGGMILTLRLVLALRLLMGNMLSLILY